MRLKDRVALITGAGHGIGRGIALAYAREGARVAITDVSDEPHAEDIARLIREAGGEAEIYRGDTSDSPRMTEIVRAVVERFGRLDIYVNNANAGRRDPNASRSYLDVTEEQLFEGFYPSFKAAFVNGQLAARRMIAQPGFIDIRLHPGERYDRFNERAETEVLLGRGEPSDIAGAAVYLASDDARYVTGAYILVDGGMLLPPITEI